MKRRQFAIAVGGILAASALGVAQVANPVQYFSPFAVAPAAESMPPTRSMPRTPQVQYVQLQPTQPGQAPQYVQVQPAQTVQPIQYVQLQPGQQVQTTQYVQVQPVQSGTTSPMPTPAPVVPPVLSVPTPAASMMPPAPAGMQYVQVQPVMNGDTVQYVPVHPVSGQAAPTPTGKAGAKPIVVTPSTGTIVTAPANQSPASILSGGCPTGNCGSSACDPCKTSSAPCGPDGRMWISAEYLLWWTRGMGIPPLVTSSATGTPREAAGVLGDPRTRVLYGDETISDDVRSGFRLRAGYWLDCCQTCGIDAGFFFLGDARDNFAAGGNGIVARPFFNTNNNQQDSQLVNFQTSDSQLVNFTDLVRGTVTVDSSTTFNGFDANFRKNVSCNCCSRIDALVGFRYLRLEDEVTITEDLTVTGTDPGRTNFPIGTRFGLRDSFTTRNEFYGANVGLTGERRSGSYFVNWRGTIAFGTVHKTASIEGSTTITRPGTAPITYPGGLLALPTNMGHYSRNDFAVVPEVGFNVGYQFTENVRVFAGYSFLYISNVTRAGDIIDLTVNPTQLPPGTLVGPARPAFAWNDTDFWAQGFNLGAELRY